MARTGGPTGERGRTMGEGVPTSRRLSPGDPSGSDATFAAAFPDLFRLAYRVAYKILGDRGDAEDVAQESLARALVRWRALQNRPYGWVSHVASNLAIDRYRKRRRGAATRDRPDHVDAFSAERSDLVRALQRLPRRQRQVVVLRYLADWSEADTAAQLGISPGSVKSHASRGLAALQAQLEPPGFGSRTPTGVSDA